jgi:alpha-beta hydrolase superfamily lysophospholipase
MLLIFAVVYLAIAIGLIVSDPPLAVSLEGPLTFDSLEAVDDSLLPELQPYAAADGDPLRFRLYEGVGDPDTVLVLLHGSAWHSMQFASLASALSRAGVAHVLTPDLRGHGITPVRRGDVDTIGQLEADLAALLAWSAERLPGARTVVGGHSSGGGLAVRFAGGAYSSEADAYLLMAPFLKHNAPTTRPNSGDWARPQVRRIAGLTMLNNVGIRWLNGLTVIQFAMPDEVLDGPLGASATTAYSYRLNRSFAPRADFGGDLSAIDRPLLVVAGSADASFYADRYEATISRYTDRGTYVLLPGIGHIDLLTDPEVERAVAAWLRGLDAGGSR